MGATVQQRLKEGKIEAKKRDRIMVPVDDVWMPSEGHALYHARGKDPINPALVADIQANGVEDDLTVRDDGLVRGKRRLTLINGSQRKINASEVQRLSGETVHVPIRFFVGDDKAALLERLRLNTDPLKVADRPSVLAATIKALDVQGATTEEILLVLPPTIGRREVEALRRWGNLTPDVQASFDAGAPVALLHAVLDAPREEQAATLAALVASGAKSSRGATRALRKEGAGGQEKRPERPHPKLVLAAATAAGQWYREADEASASIHAEETETEISFASGVEAGLYLALGGPELAPGLAERFPAGFLDLLRKAFAPEKKAREPKAKPAGPHDRSTDIDVRIVKGGAS